ncbi:MAG TPA: hypothetical protein DCR93_39460, partial [Cytophagales bacterium]|nr:hypothetical protein [Cytophagales bacterium]
MKNIHRQVASGASECLLVVYSYLKNRTIMMNRFYVRRSWVTLRLSVLPSSHMMILWLCTLLLTVGTTFAQVNTGGTATTANHSKYIIGYIDNWSAWKSSSAGVPKAGALTHLNIDYSKYTHLNFSFFGVANDGSLHSGDWRNKNIYQQGAQQAPANLLRTPTFDSWDWILLYGETKNAYYFGGADGEELAAQGFTEGGAGWIHEPSGITAGLPAPMHVPGGAPGLFELCDQYGVKLMASIGGWSMSKHMPEMAADPVKRARFLDDCERLINMGFDGIDLDWEFVGPFDGMNFTGSVADYANYVTLVSELRARLDAIRPGLLITAAISANPAKIRDWNWSQLWDDMDIINFMTYDLNGGWSNIAGHNAPIYDYPGSEWGDLNWQATLDEVKAAGIPLNKVTFGLPFYGRGVITDGPADLNAPTLKRNETVQPDGPVVTCADYTNWPKDVYDGTPNAFFVEQKISEGWTEHWDPNALVPYLTKDNFFLSYDNEQSIADKAKFINKEGIAGVIVWTVYGDLEFGGTETSYDNKLSTWSDIKSPLINVTNEVFASGATDVGGNPCTDCGGNQFPTVTLSSPTEGDQYGLGVNVTLSAMANDPDGSIAKVEFLVDGVVVGEDTTEPYSLTWSVGAVGSYAVSARATDNEGGIGTSSAASVSVVDDNQAPNVSITAPAGGSSSNLGTAVTVSAAASDADGSVASVEFFANGLSIGVDNSAPYSISWTAASAGGYDLSAIATDNDGAEGSSTVVAVTVIDPNQNTPPSVSITAPADGASVDEGTDIAVTAAASDVDGTVASVEFFVDGSSVGTDNSAPYTVTLSGYGVGSYSLTAVATDDDNDGTTSTAVSVTVSGVGGGLCEGVAEWSPSQVYTGGNEVQYNGRLYRAKYWTQNNNPETTDPWEQISRCDGYCGGLPEYLPGKAYSQGTQVIFGTNKYTANTWTTSEPGSSDWTLSGSCDGTVPNVAPTVSLTAPANNAQVDEGASVTVSASASDSDGTVASVEFFVDGVSIGTDASAPYSVSYTASTAGSYSITAQATDDDGATGSSAARTLVVNNPDVDNPPSVSITAPAGGAQFDAGASVAITANASDDKGVTSVEFFVNGASIGTDASAPYSANWTTGPAGNYILTAVATDNATQTTTSAAVSITVNPVDIGGCDGLAEFVLSTVYSSGDRVQYQGNEYRATTTIHSVYPNSAVALASGWWVDEGPCGQQVVVNAPS